MTTPQETIRKELNKFIKTIAKQQGCKSCFVSEYDIDQFVKSLLSTHEAKVREEIIKNMPLRIEHTAENGHSYETDEDKGWNNYRSQVLKILEGK